MCLLKRNFTMIIIYGQIWLVPWSHQLHFSIDSLGPGKFKWNFRYVIWTDYSDWWLGHPLWNCPNMNVIGLQWWSVNIGSGNGLVPSGNKPLPGPMLTQICRHMASIDHNELTKWSCKLLWCINYVYFIHHPPPPVNLSIPINFRRSRTTSASPLQPITFDNNIIHENNGGDPPSYRNSAVEGDSTPGDYVEILEDFPVDSLQVRGNIRRSDRSPQCAGQQCIWTSSSRNFQIAWSLLQCSQWRQRCCIGGPKEYTVPIRKCTLIVDRNAAHMAHGILTFKI